MERREMVWFDLLFGGFIRIWVTQDAIFLHFSFEKGSILVNQFADLMICVCVWDFF